MIAAGKNLFATQRVEADLDEEMRAYVEMNAAERVAGGMSAAEARRTALADFGGVEQVKQRVRDRRSGAGLQLIWQDMRYGMRQLRRNRAFTLTAVITLGLGIGATAAIFSAVYSLLLRPLPYPDASRLVWISNVWPKIHTSNVMSPDLIAARSGTRSFDQLLAYEWFDGNLTGNGDA
ncbi:MAG TPA: permease prefix domain 1-containing protein, partial [Rhizomicrobium sp.]